MKNIQLYRDAMKMAYKIRAQSNIEINEPINIFSLVEKFDLSLRFLDLQSFEGFYIKKELPHIIVNSQRPRGRQTFTCAHEFGHFLFNHNSSFDELIDFNTYDEKEFLVDLFASYLLLPHVGISNQINKRNINLNTCEPLEIFKLSTFFNVGYDTLVNQLFRNLKMISLSRYEKLKKLNPMFFKNQFNMSGNTNLLIIDKMWDLRELEVQIDDIIIFPEGWKLSFSKLTKINDNVFKPKEIGFDCIELPEIDFKLDIKVYEKNYIGLNKYKFLQT